MEKILEDILDGCDVKVTANIDSKWEDLPEKVRESIESQIFDACENGDLEGVVYVGTGTSFFWIDVLEEK